MALLSTGNGVSKSPLSRQSSVVMILVVLAMGRCSSAFWEKNTSLVVASMTMQAFAETAGSSTAVAEHCQTEPQTIEIIERIDNRRPNRRLHTGHLPFLWVKTRYECRCDFMPLRTGYASSSVVASSEDFPAFFLDFTRPLTLLMTSGRVRMRLFAVSPFPSVIWSRRTSPFCTTRKPTG